MKYYTVYREPNSNRIVGRFITAESAVEAMQTVRILGVPIQAFPQNMAGRVANYLWRSSGNATEDEVRKYKC